MHDKSDKALTIHLLEYYSELAAHHRLMMVAFVTAYIGISQALLLAPLPSMHARPPFDKLAFVVGAGLLITFVLSATMHHACHFCATAGMKAIMAADMHYQHLPKDIAQMDTFVRWISRTASKVRQSLAIRSFSVYILGLLFTLLIAVNYYIFADTAKSILEGTNFSHNAIFVTFMVLQTLALIAYTITFRRHFKHFQVAKRELSLVLNCHTQKEVVNAIERLNFEAPSSTTVTLEHDDPRV